MANRKQSPIEDADIEDFFENKPVDFRATLESRRPLPGQTSTDDDCEANHSSNQSIATVNGEVMVSKFAIPVDCAVKVRERYGCDRPSFRPKYLHQDGYPSTGDGPSPYQSCHDRARSRQRAIRSLSTRR